MTDAPTISVILAARNAEAYLDATLASITSQSFDDFELIVVDDGSTDGTEEIIERHRDSRFRVYRNDVQVGVAAARNRAISLAQGRYLATADADDLNHPDRFRIQLDFLESNPQIDIVGSNVRPFKNGRLVRSYQLPQLPHHIRWRLYFGNCIGHPTTLIRRDTIQRLGGYDPDLPVAIDYDLWLRANPGHLMANLKEQLVYLRITEESLSRRLDSQRQAISVAALSRSLSLFLETEVDRATAQILINPHSAPLEPCFLEKAVEALTAITDRVLGDPSLTVAESKMIRRDEAYKVAQIASVAFRSDPRLARQVVMRAKNSDGLSIAGAIARAVTRRSMNAVGQRVLTIRSLFRTDSILR